MQLFHNKENQLTPIERVSFKLEKSIQDLVEANIEIIFDYQFVSSELTIGDFRLDTLAFDKQNNSFVIIEYKKGHSYSVVDQGYSYLSIMLNNKAEFILEYNEKNKETLKRSDVDWSSSKVIFIAPSFNAYQKNSINFKDVPFELWEIKQFEKGLILFEQYLASSSESIQKISKGDNGSVISKVSSEIKSTSEEDHINNLNDTLKLVWKTLKEKLDSYSDTSFSVSKSYVSWKKNNKAVSFIHFRNNEFRIDISRGMINQNKTKSKGFFTLDDPKKLGTEGNWTWKNGGTGHSYKIALKNENDLDYVMYLLEQKYNSIV